MYIYTTTTMFAETPTGVRLLYDERSRSCMEVALSKCASNARMSKC